VVVGDRRMLLVIEDAGPGIAPAERERVFQRFYRIHDGDSDGCGRGLAIGCEFVARAGASVALRTPASGMEPAVEVTFDRPIPSRPPRNEATTRESLSADH